MCGHITTHYMYIQDMLRIVLAFQVTTLCMDQSTMLHSAHQYKPEEEELQKIKMYISTVKPH